MKYLKIIFLNFIIIFIFYNFVIFGMIGFSEIYRIYSDRDAEKNYNEKCIRYSCYSNYKDIQWARLHFREFNQLTFHYETPVIWRADKFKGKTINISGEYNSRLTISKIDSNNFDKKAYFFGGSVMWGFGSNDQNTIPSHFEKISKIQSFNFAESAWNSNQSLFFLIKLLKEGHKPDFVIFYNGVNELSKCNTENLYNLRSNVIQEDRLRKKFVTLRDTSKLTFDYYFSIPIEFFSKLKNKIYRSNEIKNLPILNQKAGCKDLKKTDKIAENVLQNWVLANKLVSDYGGKFFAILEPHIIFNNSEIYDLNLMGLNTEQKENIENVYSVLEQKMVNKKFFLNFKNIFSSYYNDFIFIDTHHTSPNGNIIVAKEIYKELKNRL